MQRKHRLGAAWALVAVGALGLAGTGAFAVSGLSHASSGPVVNDCTNETGTGGGDIGIADAISSASSGDTITFSCSGTIPITSTLHITTPMTIDGGSNVTFDGQNTVQVLSVKLPTASGVFTIENLTVEKSSHSGYGGGMYADVGTVYIANSTFSHNTATSSGGGVFADDKAIVYIDGSTFTDNSAPGTNNSGGAIYVNGAVTVTNSTFVGNSAGVGGAILNYGTATITSSTFSGDSATVTGDDIVAGPNGPTTVGASIIAGSCATFGLSLISNGYNLGTGNACSDLSGSHDQMNVSDLGLASSLANHGGVTDTLALLDGSPAIGAIPAGDCSVTMDQRGYARPANGGTACSIGAYEFAPQTAVTLTPASASYGDALPTLKASVGFLDSSVAGGQSAPSCGTVTFTATSTAPGSTLVTLGSASINSSGDASLTPSGISLNGGTYTLAATYTGETVAGGCASKGSYLSGTSSGSAVTLTITPASTTIALSAPSTATAGTSVTLTATVDPTVTPTGGTVTFKDGKTTLGTGTLVNGVATYTTSALSVGSHTLSASYGGTNNFAASATTTSVTINITASGTGRSGQGSTNAPQTAQASGKSNTSNPSNSSSNAPSGEKTTAGVVTQPSTTFPVALVALLAILCFGLIGGGAVLLARTRKVER